MKTKLQILFLLFFSTLVIHIQAQNINQHILSGYPASVISKVYEVASKVSITDNQQIKLAKLFLVEDSVVASAILKMQNTETIFQLHKKYDDDMQKIFSIDQFDQFYSANLSQDAASFATAQAYNQNIRFKGDAKVQLELYESYFAKYLEVAKLQQQFRYDNTLTARLKKTINHYDSSIDKVESTIYFNRQIARLDSIKPLDKTKKENLRKWFYGLCSKNSELGYKDNFYEAMQRNLNDTVYYGVIYRNEINQTALNYANQRLFRYIADYHLSSDCADKLYLIMYKKERQLAVVERSFLYFGAQKKNLQKQINIKSDSTIDLLLIRFGANSNTSQIAEALRLQKPLKIEEFQIDTLVMYEEEGIRIMKKDLFFNSQQYEREKIIHTLSEEQFDNFLINRNRKGANETSARYWSEIIQYNVAQAKDSTKIYPRIVAYNLARCVANDRYRYDDRNRPKVVNGISKTKPDVLNQLDNIRKALDQARRDSTEAKRFDENSKW
jgi:hypothetical protein